VSQAKALELLASARSLGATSFVPCGAENFMRKGFVALLKAADDLGFERQEIVTNGMLLSRHLDALAALPSVRLHVSIDGPAEVHDALRGAGVFASAVEGARGAIAQGIPVGLSTVLMRPTLETAEFIIDLARDLGILEVSFQPFQPEIAGPEREHGRWVFAAGERARVAARLAGLESYARLRGVRLLTRALLPHVVPYLFDGIRPIPAGGCHMPSQFLLVDGRGETYPCFFMRGKSMGNVERTGLEDIWHAPRNLSLQRIALDGRCPGCLAACSDLASHDAAAGRDTAPASMAPASMSPARPML
jgi:MoaA/NifB/PqqE/SkfB family radical SAM enzyme